MSTNQSACLSAIKQENTVVLTVNSLFINQITTTSIPHQNPWGILYALWLRGKVAQPAFFVLYALPVCGTRWTVSAFHLFMCFIFIFIFCRNRKSHFTVIRDCESQEMTSHAKNRIFRCNAYPKWRQCYAFTPSLQHLIAAQLQKLCFFTTCQSPLLQ